MFRISDRLNMTNAVYRNVQPPTKQVNNNVDSQCKPGFYNQLIIKMHIKIHVSVQPRFAGNSNTIQDGKFLLLFSFCVVNRITINLAVICCFIFLNNSEYDQEIPQSQTADKPMAPRG